MNSKPEIARRKEILRQHLEHLNKYKGASINTFILVRDGAYYAKDVLPYLIRFFLT
jgi:hypothetical protein